MLALRVPGAEPELGTAAGDQSSVATSRASSAGFQKPALRTYVRRRSRRLIVAAAASSVNGPIAPR